MRSLFSPLSRLWTGMSRPTRRPITRHPALRLEGLERRDTPTGNLTASFFAGTLTINAVNGTGDDNHEISIRGTGPNSVEIQGDNGTSINFGLGATPFANVTNIVVNLGVGDDVVLASGLDLSGKLTVNGGDGNDTFTLDSNLLADSILGSLTFNGGNDDDTFTVTGLSNTVSGILSAAMGNGNNTVIIGAAAGDATTVGGLSVSAGNGDDTVIIGGDAFFSGASAILSLSGGTNTTSFESAVSVDVGGPLSISAGTGTNAVTLGANASTAFTAGSVSVSSTGGDSTLTFAGLTHLINGNFTVTNGNGIDTLTAGGDSFEVIGKTTIRNGNGGSATTFDSAITTTLGGAVAITNGTGVDVIAIGNNGVGDVTLGATNLANGVDDSTITFGGLNHTINGNLVVTAGASVGGAHNFIAGGDSFSVTGSMSVVTGNVGVGTTLVALTSVTTVGVGGLLSITNSAGDDTFAVGLAGTTTSAFQRGITIRNGNGAGVTTFEGLDASVAGNVSVTNGTGNDQFLAISDVFNVSGSTTINHGAGDSVTTIGGALPGTLGGPLSITATTGLDQVNLANLATRSITAKLGNGGSQVVIGTDVLVEGNVALTAGADTNTIGVNAQINGNLTVTTGEDDDFVTLDGASVTGNTAINTGNGADTVTLGLSTFGTGFGTSGNVNVNTGTGFDSDTVEIYGSTFNGAVSVLTGNGDDTVNIAVTAIFVPTTFNKNVSINTGSGDDTVTVGLAADLDNRAVFLGQAKFEAGTGANDTLSILDAGQQNVFAFLPSITGFENGF